MFEENQSNHEVALKLDISSDKVKKYHQEYMELKGQRRTYSPFSMIRIYKI